MAKRLEGGSLAVRELLKPLLPDGHERVPLELVARLKGGEVVGCALLVGGDKIDGREFQPAQQFAQKQPGDAPVGIGERVTLSGVEFIYLTTLKAALSSPFLTG